MMCKSLSSTRKPFFAIVTPLWWLRSLPLHSGGLIRVRTATVKGSRIKEDSHGHPHYMGEASGGGVERLRAYLPGECAWQGQNPQRIARPVACSGRGR